MIDKIFKRDVATIVILFLVAVVLFFVPTLLAHFVHFFVSESEGRNYEFILLGVSGFIDVVAFFLSIVLIFRKGWKPKITGIVFAILTLIFFICLEIVAVLSSL